MTREEAIKIVKSATVYTPEEMEAFETLIPEFAESEDERIRKCIGMALTDVDEQRFKDFGITLKECLAYLEKQKAKEQYDRMAPIYNNLDSFESALDKAWKSYNDCGSRTIDSCEDDYVECAHAKGFREGYLFGIEKQKEKITKVDACGFPLRDEGESACSYLERCLAPDMRNVWYEACSEIREKQKPDSECNSNRATYKSHRESWQNRLKEIYKINSSK